jgi:ketosteroid isomerase-like protein
MRRRSIRLHRLIIPSAVALAAAISTPAAAQTDDAEAIKGVLVDMWHAIETGDIERYAAHVHPDFTSFGENDPYLNEGKDYEVQSIAGWIESSPGVHTEMHQPDVTVRGDVAWITYYWTDASMDGSSSAGKSTRIFVKENGRWLCVHGHYTNRP